MNQEDDNWLVGRQGGLYKALKIAQEARTVREACEGIEEELQASCGDLEATLRSGAGLGFSTGRPTASRSVRQAGQPPATRTRGRRR